MKFNINMENNKKILFTLILVTFLTACGGGGDSGGSGTVRPNEPVIDISPKPSIPEVLKVEPLSRNLRNYLYKTVQNINKNQNAQKGHNYWIAIMDNDFLSDSIRNSEIVKNYVEKNIKGSDYSPNKINIHGENVLGYMVKDTRFKVIAASLATKGGSGSLSISSEDYKNVFDSFPANQVKIVNQSFGELYVDSEGGVVPEERLKNDYKTQIEVYNYYINNKNGLFVLANGNVGPKNKELENGDIATQFPIVEKNLEKGMIAVIGIDGETNKHFDKYIYKKPGYKDSEFTDIHLAYAGVVKNWAISADGLGKRKITLVGNKINYSIDNGSSYAAPKVSRAAGLVASKYPWMTNNQIRETLFTTTDNPGYIKVNEETRNKTDVTSKEYGWGVLNTERALNGPGAFWKKLLKVDDRNKHNEKYYFTANVNDGNSRSYFINNIYGDSGLYKTGKGLLGLTGVNKYQGDTIVHQGILDIYGQNGKVVNESNIKIETSGELGLHRQAVLSKNMENNGSLLITSDVEIQGDYTAKPNSKTRIVVDGHNKLVVNKLTAAGKLILVTDLYEGPKVSKEIIRFNQRQNEFAEIKEQADKMTILDSYSYNPKNISISIKRKNTRQHLSSNEESLVQTANNIETVLSNIDNRILHNKATKYDKQLATTLVNMSSSTFTTAAKKMTGEIYATSQNMSLLQSQNVNRTLSNHLVNLDETINNMGWFTTFGSDGKIKKSGYASADSKIYGGQFGIDKRLNSNLVLGGAISYSYGKLEFDRDAGETKSDSVGFSIYGKENLKNDFYALARVGATIFSNRTQRELIDFDGSSVYGDIKHHDKMFSSYLEFGKEYNIFSSYVGYGIDFLERGEFKEEDATWGIEADKENYTMQNVYLGLRGKYNLNEYKITGYVEHIVNISDRSLDFDGKYVLTDEVFKFRGIAQNKNISYAGFGVSKEFTENLSGNINFDFKFEDNKFRENNISMGVKYKF